MLATRERDIEMPLRIWYTDVVYIIGVPYFNNVVLLLSGEPPLGYKAEIARSEPKTVT